MFSTIILFVIILNKLHAFDSRQENPIVSTLNIWQIETLYMEYMLQHQQTQDEICSLPNEQKTALCNLIFQQNNYQNLGVNLNKAAFYIARTTCEMKYIKFKIQSNIPDEKKQRKMYQCYAIHNPIRTSFVQDDYFDKFYVSSGAYVNSVMVYIHKFDDESEWYNLYNHLENIYYSQLRNLNITMKEAIKEINLNNEVTSNTRQKQLEYIYVREKIPTPDPICDLNVLQKMSLCRMIFSQNVYKNKFWIALNYEAFNILLPKCENKLLKIRFSKSYQKDRIIQDMYPCFAISRLHIGDPMQSKYVHYFYVSSGTRRNSLFVYSTSNGIVTENKIEKVYLFELLENINLRNLMSESISDKPPVSTEDETEENVSSMIKILRQSKVRHEPKKPSRISWEHKKIRYKQSQQKAMSMLSSFNKMKTRSSSVVLENRLKNIISAENKLLNTEYDNKKSKNAEENLGINRPTIEPVTKTIGDGTSSKIKTSTETLIHTPTEEDKQDVLNSEDQQYQQEEITQKKKTQRSKKKK